MCAHLCGDEKMRKAIADGLDLYSYCASVVYKVSYDECKEFDKDGNKNPKEYKTRRSNVKAIILGIMYGKGISSIAIDLGVSNGEAKNLYETVLKMFPKLKNFMEESQKFAKKYGYVTTITGRKCRLPEIMLDRYEYDPDKAVFFDLSNEFMESEGTHIVTEHDRAFIKLARQYRNKLEGNNRPSFDEVKTIIEEAKTKGLRITNNSGRIAEMERKCVNSQVQGSASDQMKKGMIEIYNDKILNKLGCRLVLTLHDEVLAEAPAQNAELAAQRIREIFIGVFSDILTVPSDCDVEIFSRWNGKDEAA